MKLITYSLNDKLSNIEISCINSWIKNGYEVDIYSHSLINSQFNIINPEKIIKKKYIDSISNIKIKKYFFKIKLLYKIGGIIIDTDVFCLKNYEFPSKNFISFSPYNNYSISLPDFSIIKLQKKHPILKYIINNFYYLYNDIVKGYNKHYDIILILNNLINRVYKIEQFDWKMTHSCNEEDWETQLGKKLENSGHIILKKDLGFFFKIWLDKIYENYPNLNLESHRGSLLSKIFVKNNKK